jgi:uncharacterized membrane protein YphA (DoxX/SURF4 family)
MPSHERIHALRWAAIAAQAAAILVTWPLWQARAEPPLLPVHPVLALPAVSFGPWLLGSLALVAVRPAVGIAAHCVLLALALLADQIREQPQVLSIALLLVATLPSRGARAIGVLHLAALWFWSGLGKLTSARFLGHGGQWLLLGDGDPASTPAGVAAAIALGLGELLLGAAVLLPRARLVAAWCGAALHAGALVLLAARGWNVAVWPWTALLAFAAPVLLRGETAGLRVLLARGRAVRVAAVAFAALPIGFHVGLVDAPFAQQAYTANGCHAVVLRASGRVESAGELGGVRVLLPPVPRIVEAWFAATASPGDRMILVDDRPLAALTGARERVVHAAPRGTP